MKTKPNQNMLEIFIGEFGMFFFFLVWSLLGFF